MRPIRLCMAAFGPFPEVEEIDFSRLGENPLFLINGPTGSGKSTILDGICYALYGETTGNEREAREMRCDHAKDDVLTEITLEFELVSGRYRIVRIPDQLRPKARGEGYTEQKAKAELYKLEGDEQTLLVAPKITEATEAIVNLTGLSAEQFRQVMILPQGKFRELLLAKSDERENIFQQLFQTQIYSQLQVSLREKANLLAAELREIRLQQQAVLESIDQENDSLLSEKIVNLGKELIHLAQKKQQEEKRLQELQQEIQQAKQLQASFADYENAEKQFKALEQQKTEIEEKQKQLQSASTANEIEPVYADKNSKKDALAKISQQTEDARKNSSEAENRLHALNTEYQALPEKEQQLTSIKQSIIELEKYQQYSEKLKKAQQEKSSAEQAMSLGQKQLDDQQSKLVSQKKKLEELDDTLQKKQNKVSDLADKKHQLEKLREQGEVLRKISDLNTELSRLKQALDELKLSETTAQKDAKNQQKIFTELEIKWKNGQAAILAENLQEGESCVVCGSTHHPNKAVADVSLPSESVLEKQQRSAETARQQLENIQRQILVRDEEIRRTDKELADLMAANTQLQTLSLEEIRTNYKVSRDEIQNLEKIALEIPALKMDIENTKKDIIDQEKKLDTFRQNIMGLQTELARANADLDNQRLQLPEQFRDSNVLLKSIEESKNLQHTLQQIIDTLKTQYQKAREGLVSAQTRLEEITKKQQEAKAQYVESHNLWESNLENSVFENEQDFIEARLDKDEQEKLKQIIRDYEDRKLLAEKNWQEKTRLIEGKQRPEINGLVQQEEKLLHDKQSVEQEYHQAEQQKKILEKARAKYDNLLEKQQVLDKEYGLIGRLSNISNGKNPYNLSLQRFVLSVLLDDVLTEASYRLHKMSKGRFQLYRKETVGDKRSKSGLELEVEDAYTGKQRPAATLSGGESFMAALALALGLSDVVQAYSGGIRLDMLFIDEGFGSLDPESLELAINTLLDLRDSGRMVGIISHVEELKRMIDIRLDVISDREVSHTRMIGI